MIIVKTKKALAEYVTYWKSLNLSVGFVPTMGALHDGHLALIERAKTDCDRVVCSIFVNPTQFNDPSDFQKYPITLEADITKLLSVSTDILFLPSVAELYAEGTNNLPQYDLGYLETVLEGAFRPGHFQGVCQVMDRLLSAVDPEQLFMGQKDYQQCMVVARLIGLKNFSTTLIKCPTIREADGLAMSSRNKRLSEEERKNAVGIYEALHYLQNNLELLDFDIAKQQATDIIKSHHFKLDYLEIADADTLQILSNSTRSNNMVVLAAAFQNDVRLIDNMVIRS